MVAGVPADFESRNQELSNDTKILLQDHFVRFGGKSALYVRTSILIETSYHIDRSAIEYALKVCKT